MKKWSNDSKFLAGAYPHQITYLCVAIQDSNKFDQKSEKLVRKISFYDSKTLIGAYPHPNIQYWAAFGRTIETTKVNAVFGSRRSIDLIIVML